MTFDAHGRREFLRNAAAVGVAGVAGVTGVAGCLDDGAGELRVGTSSGGTLDVGRAVERVVDRESDELEYATVDSPGYVGTIYRLDDGQFDAGITDTNSMRKARDGRGKFEDHPIDRIPYQGFLAFRYDIHAVAREDTDIEAFDDLAEANVYPGEPGFSTRATTLDIWSQPPTEDVYEEMNVVDMNVDRAPEAMEAGDVDATIAYGTPGAGLSSWVADYDERVDVRYVEPTDALVESARAYDGAGTSTTAVGDYGWEQEIGTEEVFTWNLDVAYAFHPDARDEDVYELLSVVHEQDDDIREEAERFVPVDDVSDLADAAIEDYPFHPGAAEYYRDHDAWDESWERGE